MQTRASRCLANRSTRRPRSWLATGDGGAGAPVLLEHRVSPGARLLTLAGHYGVTSERSELFIIHYPYLPDNQRQVMPVEGPYK